MRSNIKDYLEEENVSSSVCTTPGYDGIKNNKAYTFHQRSLSK